MTRDRDCLKETFDAEEEDMSFSHRLNEFLQLGYTFNQSTLTNHYHVVVVQQNLSRNIGALMTEIVDEAQTAMDDEISVTEGIALLLTTDDRLDAICSLRKSFENYCKSE
jgi:hypothetical protein